MKRLISFLLLFVMILSLCVPAYAETTATEEAATEEAETEFMFKQFKWGDTKDYVISVEGEPELSDTVNGLNAEYIAYQTSVAGVDMLLAYYFCKDGLFQIRYLSTESHSNPSLYIDDFNTIKKAFVKKYGAAPLDTKLWSSDSKKKLYSDDLGKGLEYGYLTYYAAWSFSDTTIWMEMSADNYDVTTQIDYNSMEISPGEVDYSDEI